MRLSLLPRSDKPTMPVRQVPSPQLLGRHSVAQYPLARVRYQLWEQGDCAATLRKRQPM